MQKGVIKVEVIALVNQKGGVGKSTTAANLGFGLARQGKKVLLIDNDPQQNLSTILGWHNTDDFDVTLATIYEKIICGEKISINEGVLQHKEKIDLIPSNIELAGLEVSLVNTMSRETILKTYINDIKRNYDYVIIDCNPSLGMLTINALTAADKIIIPVQADFLPTRGLQQLLVTVNKVKRQLNPSLKIDGILLTMVDKRTNFSKNIISLIRDTYKGNLNVFQSEIPRSIRAVEMSASGSSIYVFEPDGKLAKAYEQFTKEVLNNERCYKKYKIDQLR